MLMDFLYLINYCDCYVINICIKSNFLYDNYSIFK